MMVPGDGEAAVVVDHRLAATKRHYWGRHDQLGTKHVPLMMRLQRYVGTVRESWLYASGTLTLSQAAARRIRWHDHECARRVWRPKRKAEEPWLDWQVRTSRGAGALLLRGGHLALLQKTLERYHMWAGHVARLVPDNIVSRCTMWKGSRWWHNRQQVCNWLDPLNRTGWRHGRTGDHQRWDKMVYEYYGPDWAEAARDREEWAQRREAFVAYFHGEWIKSGEIALEDGAVLEAGGA